MFPLRALTPAIRQRYKLHSLSKHTYKLPLPSYLAAVPLPLRRGAHLPLWEKRTTVLPVANSVSLPPLQVIPQGSSPTPCIPCCLVVTAGQLLTCHQDCQTSFFRSLGMADLSDVTGVRLEADQQYCVVVSAPPPSPLLPQFWLSFGLVLCRATLLYILTHYRYCVDMHCWICFHNIDVV